jgi:hypothetical protein
MENVVDDEHYDDLLDGVARWQRLWNDGRHPVLRYRKAFSSVVIEDGRGRRQRKHTYSDGTAALYEYCADARTLRDIASAMGSEPWVQKALDEFVRKDLMLFLDGRYLSLALPQHPNFELASDLRPSAAASDAQEGLVPPRDLAIAIHGGNGAALNAISEGND